MLMLHPITWLVWLTAATTAALSTRNPLYLVIIMLAAAAVRVTWRGQSPTALAWGILIRLGLMLWSVTALFDALVAHQGVTILFNLPAGWPLVGGPITLESLLYGLISGLALTTLLIIFATFNSSVSHHRLLRFTPAFLRQAGLIVSIALVFVPQMTAALQDIRRAQRLRGHRFRGVRDLMPLLVPLLGNALERAIGLAEAMEAQGFSAESDRASTGIGRRLAMLVGVLGVVCGLFVMRYWPQRLWAGWAFIGLGAAVFLAAGWGAGPAQKRTRYRAEHLEMEDAVTIAAAAITLSVVGTLTLVRPGLLDYSPYPRVLMPAFQPLLGLALVLLATPALVARRKTGEQRGADTETHQPTPFILASGVRVSTDPLIEVQNVSYWYPDSKAPALRGVSLSLTAGEFTLVIGPSGAGKSTFLRLLNGLVPHFTGGTIAGTVRVAGRDPVSHGTSKMAHIAGFVFQDPEAQFVTEQVEDELVFALENHGYSRAEIERRLAWVLDVLDLHHLRQRRADTLSGGERQRVAIGSVLALQPQVLILDEPTSQLDPAGADEVLRAVTELNRRLGLTVVLAEHRLERVLPYADKVVYFPGQGQTPVIGRPRDVMEKSDLVPPIVNLARTLGWQPLPLTVEEARGYIERSNGKKRIETTPGGGVNIFELMGRSTSKTRGRPPGPSRVALRVSDLWYAYDGSNTPALRGVSLEVAYGETVAVVGSNGAGKTTLLRCVMGLIQPEQGEIEILGQDRRTRPTEELAQQVGFVPQNAGAMLFADSVREEVAYTRRSQHLPPDGREVLETFGLMPLAEQYPWDLSVGERQRVAIAAFLSGEPRFLLLDEPTRGLDYRQKATLTSILRQHQTAGHATLLVTHDVELVAAVADRMVILEDGQVVAEGPTSDVMRDHPRFASQISRLFNDGHAEG